MDSSLSEKENLRNSPILFNLLLLGYKTKFSEV